MAFHVLLGVLLTALQIMTTQQSQLSTELISRSYLNGTGFNGKMGPIVRYGHATTVDPETGYIYLYGGQNIKTDAVFCGFWRFNVMDLSWMVVEPVSSSSVCSPTYTNVIRPGSLTQATLQWHKGKIYLLGGCETIQCPGKLFLLRKYNGSLLP